MSSGDRDSYYKAFGTKRQNRRSHSDDLSVLFKNSAENNNGAVVGHKRPITNNDGGSNTPAKVACCQNLAKTVSDVEVQQNC